MNSTKLDRRLSAKVMPIGAFHRSVACAVCGGLILALSLAAAPAGAQQADNSAAEALDRIGMQLQQRASTPKPRPHRTQSRHGLPSPPWLRQLHFDQQLQPADRTTVATQ